MTDERDAKTAALIKGRMHRHTKVLNQREETRQQQEAAELERFAKFAQSMGVPPTKP